MESLASGLSANGWQRREQGTLEWKNKNVNIETYFDLLTEKKIPSIIKLWPIGEWSNTKFSVTIQQDGAPAHTTKAFGQRFALRLEEMVLGGLIQRVSKIILVTQPPNSPDPNIYDLGLFRAIQSLYYRACPRNVGELIAMVEQAYSQYPATKINQIWLTLMGVFNCIVEHHGHTSKGFVGA